METRGSQELIIACLVFSFTSKFDGRWRCHT